MCDRVCLYSCSHYPRTHAHRRLAPTLRLAVPTCAAQTIASTTPRSSGARGSRLTPTWMSWTRCVAPAVPVWCAPLTQQLQVCKWCRAKVTQLRGSGVASEISVTYPGWGSQYDEWVPLWGCRVAQPNTRHLPTVPCPCPCPHVCVWCVPLASCAAFPRAHHLLRLTLALAGRTLRRRSWSQAWVTRTTWRRATLWCCTAAA